jgi:two-component system sensor histidine kinase VicK
MNLKHEDDLYNIVLSAPIGICVLNSETLAGEIVNDSFLEVAGKPREDIIGKFYWDAFAEAREYYEDALNQAVANDEPYYANEVELMLIRHGREEMVFVTFVYSPIKNSEGKVTKVAVWVLENTAQVIARQKIQTANNDLERAQTDLQNLFQKLEESEIALRLAVSAANFGTWYIQSVTREFITDARLKELFGYYPDEDITIEGALAQITDEYRGFVSATLENAIYKGGDYDVTYPVIGLHNDKLRWLRAIGNLKADPSGEFSAFTGVVMDISEQKQDEQRKNDFIGMVSHELKTPLTSLNAYLQVLQTKILAGADSFTSGALDQSVKQVRKMTVMINGFLNVSRLESGKINIEKQLFDMSEMVAEIEEETIAMISTHQFIFHPVESVYVTADKDKIAQVLSNLISNAVKYSTAGTLIKVSCAAVNNNAQISVTDEGAGIHEQDIDRIFERYSRIQTDHNQHISGFGIGLYLSKEIIKRHGGKIWVESKSGIGSTFYFSLPL